MDFWEQILDSAKSGAAAQFAPARMVAETFLAPLKPEERVAVSDLSPFTYPARHGARYPLTVMFDLRELGDRNNR